MKFLKKIVKIVFFCQIENNLKLNPFPRSPLEQRIIQMETNLQFFFVFFRNIFKPKKLNNEIETKQNVR